MAGPVSERQEARFRADDLRRLATRAAQAYDVPADDAALFADTLVSADLRGVSSHGLVRLSTYLRRIRDGGSRVPAELRFDNADAAVSRLDGGAGLGQVVAARAMESAIKRAPRHGIGVITVANSSHLGAAAYYAMMAVEHQMIGIAITNTPPAMAPYGGIDRLLGNNPFAVAVPAGRMWPVVLDMAQTVVARGWIKIASDQGRTIPAGWATDAAGEPTTDAAEALNGLLLPMGGYKGYGLAVIVEILAGVLSGAAILSEIGELGFSVAAGKPDTHSGGATGEQHQNVGHFMAAIDIARFQPNDVFNERMEALVSALKSSRLAPGATEILLPGEKEHRFQQERERDGVPLPSEVVSSLQSVASEAGLEFPSPVQR